MSGRNRFEAQPAAKPTTRMARQRLMAMRNYCNVSSRQAVTHPTSTLVGGGVMVVLILLHARRR